MHQAHPLQTRKGPPLFRFCPNSPTSSASIALISFVHQSIDRFRTKNPHAMLSSWKRKMNDRSVPFELQVGISRVGNSTYTIVMSVPKRVLKTHAIMHLKALLRIGPWRMHQRTGKAPETYKHHIATRMKTTRAIAMPPSVLISSQRR
jgi:hypothetical protein